MVYDIDFKSVVDIASTGLKESNLDGKITSLTYANGGNNHCAFDITLDEKDSFRLRTQSKKSVDEMPRNTYFGHLRSLESQNVNSKHLLEAGIPISPIHYTGKHLEGEADECEAHIIDIPRGTPFNQYLVENEFEFSKYLNTMKSLGEMLGKAHSYKLSQFGTIGEAEAVDSFSTTKFDSYSDYLTNLIGRHFENKETLLKYGDKNKVDQIESYARSLIGNVDCKPSLVIYDLHPANFGVDESGKVASIYNSEFCQAAHPNLEMGTIAFQYFGYFSDEHTQPIKEAFLEGYSVNGDVNDINQPKLEELHLLNHMLSAVRNYSLRFPNDEKRAPWPQQLFDQSYKIAEEGEVKSYQTFAKIVRPDSPNKPKI